MVPHASHSELTGLLAERRAHSELADASVAENALRTDEQQEYQTVRVPATIAIIGRGADATMIAAVLYALKVGR